MKIVFLSLFALACLAALTAASAPGPQKPETGRAPYGQWKHGPSSDPGYFPIAVWLQSPENAARYKAAGINLYIGLWQGPTETQLAALKAAGMPVICDQNAVGMAHKDDPTIVGWMHGDEPDNAQPVTDPATGKQDWGPCIPPARIVADYARLRAADPSRPVLLNLGQGVANDRWVGRGSGAKLEDYETYVKGCDVVSFDVYPVADRLPPDGDNLWYVPKGIDRLVKWTGGGKPVWNCIECTYINGDSKATPQQVRAEIWSALIHGSRGLIYFVHEFKPKFNEHALLDDPPMLAEVTRTNRQIHTLAPVLNSAPVPDGATVTSSSASSPLDWTVRRHEGRVYLFAVAPRKGATHGTFTVRGLPANATAEVLDEGRTLPVRGGKFEDDFKPFEAHLYRISGR